MKFFISLLTILLLFGCNQKNNISFTTGTIEDDAYINETLNIKFKHPKNFDVYSKGRIKNRLQTKDDDTYQYEYFAFNRDNNDYIMLTAKINSDTILKEKAYLKLIIDEINKTHTEGLIIDINENIYKEELSGNTFYCFEAYAYLEDQLDIPNAINKTCALKIDSGFFNVICNTKTKKSMNDIFSNFEKLK